jgi:hypothetical protein
MTGASSKAKNKMMLQAAKALAAAATSLASAAEALTLLCEEDDEEYATAKSGGPASIGDQKSTIAPTPNATSVVDYDDSAESDDEYMTLAREEVRTAAVAAMSKPDHTPPGMILGCLYWRRLTATDSTTKQNLDTTRKTGSSISPIDIQARFGNGEISSEAIDAIWGEGAEPPQSQPASYKEPDLTGWGAVGYNRRT